jgi:starch phosphorylase
LTALAGDPDMLPPALFGLERLSRNLWWSWDAEATELWRSIDPYRWEQCRHNPVAILHDIEDARFAALAKDPAFTGRLARVLERFDAYVGSLGWCSRGAPEVRVSGGIAYLSMEFGLHESLRIYSGGLGVLAGDHLRSASDLGVPLTGIGLLYRKGYFRQVIEDGQQVAAYPEANWNRLPIRLLVDAKGEAIEVLVPVGHHEMHARIWQVDVGRNRLLLLDTDFDRNNAGDRASTHHLYGGNQETRIHQEMLLGVGGVRALRALGVEPTVFHMNEGHCAFAVLELARERMAAVSCSFDSAIAWVKRRCVFTTHTPVAAGHDRFGLELVEKALGTWRKLQKLPDDAFMALGRVDPADKTESLCMTVLALRASARTNGVSALHGEVSREMWKALWPDKPVADVPIGHITNGVHPFFWMAPEAQALLDDHVPGWRDTPWDARLWAAIEKIPAKALWSLRHRLRSRLVDVVATKTGRKLDPEALTIGFARRFAPYKRGDLLFRDPDRLAKLLEQGVQVVYAGKAHPADTEGQRLVAEVVRWTSTPTFRDRIAFVEEYDLALGHTLTAGADVWLNNPRRPQEASGTSGQKVLLNGGINLSILDGWWAEGYDGSNGWAIGGADVAADQGVQDAADAESLYEMLEQHVLPAWRVRDPHGLPAGWITRMRRSMATGIPAFNTHRMVRDYVLDMYLPVVRDVTEDLADAETEEADTADILSSG